MQKAVKIIAFLAFALLVGRASTPEESAYLSLYTIIQQTLDNNPAKDAAGASVDATAARVNKAGVLPDPMLNVGVMNVPVDSLELDQEPMTQVTVGVSQTIPYPGKLHRRTEVSEFALDVEKHRDAMTRQELVYKARATFHELVFLERAIEITETNRDLLKQLAGTAQARFKIGEGIQQDPVKAQLELSRLIEEQIGYEQARASTAFEINRLINADPSTPVPRAHPPKKRPPVPDRDEIINLVKTRNPGVLAARAGAEQAGAAYELAGLSALPDLTLALSYGIREDGEMNGEKIERPDFVSASVSVPIPLWKRNKQDQEKAEMMARQKQARSNALDVEARTVTRAEILLTELEKRDEQITLHETGIIPQARLSLESARAAYRTGRVDFLSLVNATITLQQTELRLERLSADYFKTMAALDMITGRPVEEILEENQQ